MCECRCVCVYVFGYVCVHVCVRARAFMCGGLGVGGKCDIFNVGVGVTVFVVVWAFSWL